MHAVEKRLLDLVGQILSGDALSSRERAELKESHQWLTNRMRKREDLESLSFIAHCNADYDWEMEICAELEKLERS
ncbi:hypothetical protein NIE88_10405 [Sporolactobacillus shoreicorticis]|uniref:Uncharacterized protein n=1 Tax=Sporolactobacillus shoreicorticis TaxID=1923877 RepID=A0ABW5S8H0_9BACL|nr:hypothetical protein [Sporolactobacillus shoreicorticis]MCO7126186.1 hypothetical protein [Sporolactobacillus shoreicorticis]